MDADKKSAGEVPLSTGAGHGPCLARYLSRGIYTTVLTQYVRHHSKSHQDQWHQVAATSASASASLALVVSIDGAWKSCEAYVMRCDKSWRMMTKLTDHDTLLVVADYLSDSSAKGH